MRPSAILRSLGGWLAALSLLGTPVAAAASGSAELALADAGRERASAGLASADVRLAAATGWLLDRARARLRWADRQQQADAALAARRRELATGIVGLREAAGRDVRARVVLAGLTQAVAAAREEADRLQAPIAGLARELRAATALRAIWAMRRAAAAAESRAAGGRWRDALTSRMTALATGAATRRRAMGAVLMADAVTLAAAPASLRLPTPAHHKHAMPADLRLDRRLLRLVSVAPARRPARRLHASPAVPAGPILPIAGEIVASGSRAVAMVSTVDQVVSSPVAGTVMFAEPFRGLGPLLIIDRGSGYHVVLTGLARLDVRRGASVVAGQSLGEIVARMDGPARLQLEFRHRGLPIDPLPWLAARYDKVRS